MVCPSKDAEWRSRGPADGGLRDAEGLESHGDARVVHQQQHPAEALAAFAHETRGGAIERNGDGGRPVMAEFLLQAFQRSEGMRFPSFPSVYVSTRKSDIAFSPAPGPSTGSVFRCGR